MRGAPARRRIGNGGARTEGADSRARALLLSLRNHARFRHKFLDHNRLWLLDQLSNMLTPRTARRLRLGGGGGGWGGGAMSDDEEGSEMGEFDEVELTPLSAQMMRAWLAAAKARAPGRFARRSALDLSEDTGDETGADVDEDPLARGLRRFGAVQISTVSSSIAIGWLAAMRQLRRHSSLVSAAIESSSALPLARRPGGPAALEERVGAFDLRGGLGVYAGDILPVRPPTTPPLTAAGSSGRPASSSGGGSSSGDRGGGARPQSTRPQPTAAERRLSAASADRTPPSGPGGGIPRQGAVGAVSPQSARAASCPALPRQLPSLHSGVHTPPPGPPPSGVAARVAARVHASQPPL